MTVYANPSFGGSEESNARSWYERWRRRIYSWVRGRSNSSWADALLLLPDLFALCLGLILDKRTPSHFKLLLLLALQYVLNPLDIIPEAAFGVAGLADDLSILLLALKSIFDAEFETVDEIAQDHWHGDEHPAATVARLLNLIGNLAGDLLTRMTTFVRRARGSAHPGGASGADPEPVPII